MAAQRNITGLAVSPDGLRSAFSDTHGRVAIVDLATATPIATFQTVFESGGERLALSRDGSTVIAGAYSRHGVAAYDSSSGTLLWQRRELKGVQHLRCSARNDTVYVGLERGAGSVLSERSGITLQSKRGVRDFVESAYGPLILIDCSRPRVVCEETFDALFAVERMSFAFLAAGFSQDALVISEAGGPVRCFDLSSGQVRWTFTPEKGVHCLKVAYSAQLKTFVGVMYPYETGRAKSLVKFASDGRVNLIAILGRPAEVVFSALTAELVTTDRIIVSASGATTKIHIPE